MLRPILYSFRRCPYAIRARLALAYTGVEVELREVVLKDKPVQMLELSPKATVPVLQLADGQVIDESLDIMRWAIQKHDPQNWADTEFNRQIDELILRNDNEFKPWLDRYKYADRYPEQSQEYYRQQCESWFSELDELLNGRKGILRDSYCLADMALFPFVRQCAFVDKAWFDQSSYGNLQRWLSELLQSPLFLSVMTKYPQWQLGDEVTIFPDQGL